MNGLNSLFSNKYQDITRLFNIRKYAVGTILEKKAKT